METNAMETNAMETNAMETDKCLFADLPAALVEVKSKIVCKLPRLLNSSQPDTQ